MAIKYCSWIEGDDSTGDGSPLSPYKTITAAITGAAPGDEIRCEKSEDPKVIHTTINWVYGSNTIDTPISLLPSISIGDIVGKGTDEYWYEVINITETVITLHSRYAGTTQQTTLYKLKTVDTGEAGSISENIQSIANGINGVAGNRIVVSGGWNLDTGEQTGWTTFRQTGAELWGRGIYYTASTNDSEVNNFITFTKLRFSRYQTGILIRNGNYIDIEDVTFINCQNGLATDRCFLRRGNITRVTALCYTNGCYFIQSSYYNIFQDCHFDSCNRGIYCSGNDSTNFIFRNCTFNHNRESGIRASGSNVSFWLIENCSFNDNFPDSVSGNGYGFYNDQSSSSYNVINNCEFLRNSTWGAYLAGSGYTVNASKSQYNGNGVMVNTGRIMLESCIITHNTTTGLRCYHNNAAHQMWIRHTTIENNELDIWFDTNVQPPIGFGYPVYPYSPRYEIDRTTWKFEGLNVGTFRVDYHPSYGSTNTPMQQYGSDWMFKPAGIIAKHTGMESRGGVGSCIMLEPKYRRVTFLEADEKRYRDFNYELTTEFPILITDNTYNKRLKIFLKRTSDFIPGVIYLSCLTNNSIIEGPPLDVTEQYTEFSLIIPKEQITVGKYYDFIISVIPHSGSYNSGRVYADDFSVEDIPNE